MKHLDLVERLLLDDSEAVGSVVNHLLVEDEEAQLVQVIGDTSLVHYCMKCQQFIEDELDLYVFKGWEDAEIVGPPKVEKFWVTFVIMLPAGAEYQYAERFQNNKMGQNQITVKQLDDGSYLVRVRILKRFLDALELRDKDKSEQLADEDFDS